MLIGIYLLFYNKKELTNGIDGFILCAMNANEISPKANSRLYRIKIASRIAKWNVFVFFIFAVFFTIFNSDFSFTLYAVLVFITNLPNHFVRLVLEVGATFSTL